MTPRLQTRSGEASARASVLVAGGYLGNKIGTGTANTIATTIGIAMGAYFGGRLFDKLSRGDLNLTSAA